MRTKLKSIFLSQISAIVALLLILLLPLEIIAECKTDSALENKNCQDKTSGNLNQEKLTGTYILSVHTKQNRFLTHQDISNVTIAPKSNYLHYTNVISFIGDIKFVDTDGEKQFASGSIRLVRN